MTRLTMVMFFNDGEWKQEQTYNLFSLNKSLYQEDAAVSEIAF